MAIIALKNLGDSKLTKRLYTRRELQPTAAQFSCAVVFRIAIEAAFVSLLAAYPMALTSDVCPCLTEKPSLYVQQ
jgi:hypothetical protein